MDGTREVAGPVTFSILTNIVAFVPLMFIPGETGKFWGPLPVVVIIVLSLSLIESLFILPAHLAHARAGGRKRHGLGARLHHGQQAFSRAFNRLVDFAYRPVLDPLSAVSLHHRLHRRSACFLWLEAMRPAPTWA